MPKKAKSKAQARFLGAVELAYLAGIIDGEGTIGLHERQGIGEKKRWCIRFIVTNTDFRLIQWLIDNFGGNFYKKTPKVAKWKVSYVWTIYDTKKCYDLIKKIKPYLVLKNEQADVVIKFQDSLMKLEDGYKNGVPEKVYNKRLELVNMCKKLNSRGVLV